MQFRTTKDDIVIDIKNLTFSYTNNIILDNINLTIQHKDFLAIIGPNGGGKSTLLKLILGLHKYKIGNISISKKYISKIGYVPQNTNINIDFPITVLDVVLMGHINKKRTIFRNNKADKICAMNSLKRVSMDKYYNVKIGSLSGGQRQRVMIARALCANPDILILDEPTSSIDVDGQNKIYELLKELNRSLTIIVVSHDISVILSYASKVAHINNRLVFHNIEAKKSTFHKKDHFCEVEMLELLGDSLC